MDTAVDPSTAVEALALVDIGILVVDATARVSYANAAADELLQLHPELRLVRRHLRFASDTLQERFSLLLRQMLPVGNGPPASAQRALSIPSAGRLPMSLSMRRLGPHADGTSSALLLLRDPEWPALDRRCLRELFGLTPAESVVAADLGRGCYPDQIAVRHGMGVATVRTHMRNILSKTGTCRMAQAVAVIGRSVASLGLRTDMP